MQACILREYRGHQELKRKAHTIVALCPCRLGEEYCFLKVLKCRSYNPGKEVTVLKRNTDNGVFFHFAGKMQEEDALPLPARKPTASAASSMFLGKIRLTHLVLL